MSVEQKNATLHTQVGVQNMNEKSDKHALKHRELILKEERVITKTYKLSGQKIKPFPTQELSDIFFLDWEDVHGNKSNLKIGNKLKFRKAKS